MVVLITPFEEPEGVVVRVTPQGDLDLVGGAALRRSMSAVIRRHRPHHIDVDLAYVTFLDCSGVRTLIWAERRMRRLGGTLALLQPSDSAMWLLKFLRLDRRLWIRHEPRPAFALRRLALGRATPYARCPDYDPSAN